MRNFVRRFTILVFIAALLCCCTGCDGFPRIPGLYKPTATPAVTAAPILITPELLPVSPHDDVRFASMQYTRPDVDAIEADIDQLARDIEADAPTERLIAAYDTIKARYDQANSAMSLAYLLYAFDVTTSHYEEEYAFLQSALSKLDLTMTDVSIRLYEHSDDARARMDGAYGKAYIDAVYRGQSLNSNAIQQLLDKEQSLVAEYDRLSATFTLQDGGKEWTLDDIYTDDSLSVRELYRLVDAYYAAFNESAGKCFLELTDIRNDISEKLGYGSYSAYQYDCYSRDYTIDDAKSLHKAVKTHIVPLFVSAQSTQANTETFSQTDGHEESGATGGILGFADWALTSIRELSGLDQTKGDDASQGLYDLYCATYDQEAFLKNLSLVAEEFSPSLNEALQYMLRNDLYDLSVTPKKMSGSFTTYLAEYHAPFIFSQWENNSTSVDTFVHEFGHFANYYHNPHVGWSVIDSLDLAEVDSQALQLLMTPYYDTLYGAQYSKSAKYSLLLDCMYALVTGCMEDEFQQTVYANPGMTLEELNDVYYQLAEEYGLTELYGYRGTEWAMVPHTFQTPMYYISYAVSMVPALELWEISQTEPVRARTAYLKIIDRAPYANFREELQQTGLSDVFSETTIQRIAEVLATQL